MLLMSPALRCTRTENDGRAELKGVAPNASSCRGRNDELHDRAPDSGTVSKREREATCRRHKLRLPPCGAACLANRRSPTPISGQGNLDGWCQESKR